MRKVDLLALAGVAVLLAGAVAYGQRDEPAVVPDELVGLREAAALAPCPTGLTPELEGIVLSCLAGGPDVDAGARPSGPALLNVWGTWCAPCVKEVPELVAFAAKAQGRVGVVGVLTTDTERNGLVFAEQFGMRYPNVVDDDGLVRARYGTVAPVTLFVDADGAVTHREFGEMESLAEIESLVAEHLGVRL